MAVTFVDTELEVEDDSEFSPGDAIVVFGDPGTFNYYDGDNHGNVDVYMGGAVYNETVSIKNIHRRKDNELA